MPKTSRPEAASITIADHDSRIVNEQQEGTRRDVCSNEDAGEERERTYFGEPLSLPFPPPPPLLLRCPDISKTFYFYEGSPTPSCSVYDLERSWLPTVATFSMDNLSNANLPFLFKCHVRCQFVLLLFFFFFDCQFNRER